MSSHHIVREKQEPALLVLGLDNFPDELLGQLLEWSPTVIATKQTAENLNSRGIKIDLIILTESADEIIQSDINLIPAAGASIVESALKFLSAFGYPAVNIITDELNLKDFEFYTALINVVIFSDHRKIIPVKPGFSKWKPFGEHIELLSNVNNLVVDGLESAGRNRYKTIRDGFFTLKFDGPLLFIAEDI